MTAEQQLEQLEAQEIAAANAVSLTFESKTPEGQFAELQRKSLTVMRGKLALMNREIRALKARVAELEQKETRFKL